MTEPSEQQKGEPAPGLGYPDGDISFSVVFSILSNGKREDFWFLLFWWLRQQRQLLSSSPEVYGGSGNSNAATGTIVLGARATGRGRSRWSTGLSLLSGLGLRNPSDLYIGILESRTIADSLIKKYDFRKVYHDDNSHMARKHLSRNTAIGPGKIH